MIALALRPRPSSRRDGLGTHARELARAAMTSVRSAYTAFVVATPSRCFICSLKAVRADIGRMKTVRSATRPSSSSSRKSMPSSSRSPTRGLEAQGDGVAFGQLVDVGEVLERGGDVGEDLADDLAALEAAEEDRAVQDDVLAQRLGQQLEVLGFGGAAERVRLGHRATLAARILAPCRATTSLRGSPTPSGATGLRWTGKLNMPLYRLSGGRIGGKVGRAPVLLLTTTGRKSGQQRTAPVVYLADGEQRRRDQHQRRQRQGPGLVAQPEGQPGGRGRDRPQSAARSAPASPRARSAPTSGASTTSSTRASTTTRRSSTARPSVFVLEPR